MVDVKIGDFINLNESKRGMGSKGIWMFGSVKAEKGTDNITVFIDNADVAQNWDCGKIVEIKRASINHKQVNGKWYTQYLINAILEKANPIEAGFHPDLLAENNLPFN